MKTKIYKLPNYKFTPNQLYKFDDLQPHAERNWNEFEVMDKPICIGFPHNGRALCMFDSSLRCVGDSCVIVPICDIKGKIWNYQRLTVSRVCDGFFNVNYRVRTYGCFHSFGELGDKMIIATDAKSAYAIYKVTGITTIATFIEKNHWDGRKVYINLKYVAMILRYYFPKAEIIIAGDNNMVDRGGRDFYGKKRRNVGREAAYYVARKIDASVVMPLNHGRGWQLENFHSMWVWLGDDALLEWLQKKVRRNTGH